MERGLYLKPDECPCDQAKHTSKRIPTSRDGPCSPNLIGRRIWPANGRHLIANGRQLHPTDTCNHSKCFRSPPFAACPTSLGSGG